MKAVLRECRSYVEYFIIPAMAVIMPWWLAIRFFRLIAHIPFLYRSNAETCANGAVLVGVLTGNDKQWICACKIGLMLDYADVFLLRFGRSSFGEKIIAESIKSQLQSQQIIFTPHYGCGMWVFWLLQKEQVSSAVFINRPENKRTAEGLFGWMRLSVIERLGATIVSPANKSELRQLISEGSTIIALPDIPVAEGLKFYQPETELGKLNLLAFFFDLAETNNLPVLHIIFSADIKTGLREFNAAFYRNLTAKEYAWHFARLTAKAIKARSYLWRMMVTAPEVLLPLDSE